MELKTLQIWRKKLDTKLRKKKDTRNFIIKKITSVTKQKSIFSF